MNDVTYLCANRQRWFS